MSNGDSSGPLYRRGSSMSKSGVPYLDSKGRTESDMIIVPVLFLMLRWPMRKCVFLL